MRLLFGVRIPDEASSVEIRPVFTGSSRPRPIFRGRLQPLGGQFDENFIYDKLARDRKFWRWIYSEERARRLRTERNGLRVRFKLTLFFFNRNDEIIYVDKENSQASLTTCEYEIFDNESDISQKRRY